MTTIAYRDGILASDSKMTANGTYVGNYEKVLKVISVEKQSWFDKLLKRDPITTTYLVGCCGVVNDIQDYMEFIFSDGPQPTGDLNCLIVTIEEETREILLYESGAAIGMKIDSDYVATGSGSEVALGALYQGATAVEAVEAAIHHDNMSGGKIQTVSFNDE